MKRQLRIQSLPPIKGTTWCIGDIHGCADELERLLNRISPRSGDRLVALGDLVNRGPESHRVLKIAREAGILPLLGNHELRLLQRRANPSGVSKRKSDTETLRQLKKKDWEWMADWPHVYLLAEPSHLLVHGGFHPQMPWQKQSPDMVTLIQVLDPKGKAAKRSDFPKGPPWATRWKGPQTVVYGHTPRPAPLIHDKAIGIDTGCVYGYHLTALDLERQRFKQVLAAQPYVTS